MYYIRDNKMELVYIGMRKISPNLVGRLTGELKFCLD